MLIACFIVHELTHFIERTRSEPFVAVMDQRLPDWRARRDKFNGAPLAHEEWGAEARSA